MATSGLSLLICVTAADAGHPTTSGHDAFGVLILLRRKDFSSKKN
jgi:hypothetical protein